MFTVICRKSMIVASVSHQALQKWTPNLGRGQVFRQQAAACSFLPYDKKRVGHDRIRTDASSGAGALTPSCLGVWGVECDMPFVSRDAHCKFLPYKYLLLPCCRL